MDDIFVEMLLSDKVRLTPAELGCNVQDVLLRKLRSQMEGRCTHHGYIKPDSIQLRRSSLSLVQAFTLNGDAVYRVAYTAQVCNPSIGSVVRAKVVNMNKFGLLAEAVVQQGLTPVLEIIVARTMVNAQHDVPIDTVRVNDSITVQILGKKYELNERRISVVGRLVDPATAAVVPLPDHVDATATPDDDGEEGMSVEEEEDEQQTDDNDDDDDDDDDGSSSGSQSQGDDDDDDKGLEEEEEEEEEGSEKEGPRNKAGAGDEDDDDFESVPDDGSDAPFDGDEDSYISDSE